MKSGWKFLVLLLTLIAGVMVAGCSAGAALTEPEDDFEDVAIPTTPPIFGFGNGAPSGAHYNLNVIGVPKEKSADMTGNSGHRIFVKLEGKTRILLCESGVTTGCEDIDGFQVLDANGTDGRASFALPHPDPANSGTPVYSVYVRALGKPGGTATNTTCGIGAGEDGILGTADDEEVCSVIQLTLERKSGKSRFVNVSDVMLYVWVDIDEDGTLDRIPLFDDQLADYFWEFDNKGLKLAQFRFYESLDDGGTT